MTFPLRKIVVGTSLDPSSDGVVRAALQLKEKTGAELHLVHAYALPVVYGGGFYPTIDPAELLELQKSRLVDAQLERLRASKEDFAEIVALVDYPDRLIQEVADRVGADLVVIGASETSPRLQPFFGSTADRLLRRVHRPVLVVRGELTLPQEVLALTDLSELSEAVLARGSGLLDQFGAGGPRPGAFRAQRDRPRRLGSLQARAGGPLRRRGAGGLPRPAARSGRRARSRRCCAAATRARRPRPSWRATTRSAWFCSAPTAGAASSASCSARWRPRCCAGWRSARAVVPPIRDEA